MPMARARLHQANSANELIQATVLYHIAQTGRHSANATSKHRRTIGMLTNWPIGTRKSRAAFAALQRSFSDLRAP